MKKLARQMRAKSSQSQIDAPASQCSGLQFLDLETVEMLNLPSSHKFTLLLPCLCYPPVRVLAGIQCWSLTGIIVLGRVGWSDREREVTDTRRVLVTSKAHLL